MKKVIPGLICLLLITSCGLEPPKSIAIKGSPELFIPLGSPFASLNDGERLEDLISPDNIKKMMNSTGTAGIEVYEVSPDMAIKHGIDKNVLTYLVEYQLADMPLDLQKYMDQVMIAINTKEEISIPEFPAEWAGYVSSSSPLYIDENGDLKTYESTPFLKIPLNDMRKLIKKVTRDANGKFGLEIPEINRNPLIADYLELKIPALDINDYTKGNVVANKLLFVNENGSDFEPRAKLEENGELWVYAKITGVCPAGIIEPAIVFEWEAAEIDTGEIDNSNFTETYPIGNSLGDFLGGTVSFKEVRGYVYMSGMEESGKPINMTVRIGNLNPEKRSLKNAKQSLVFTSKPDGTQIVDGDLTTSSFTGPDPTAPLNLTPIFKSADVELKVDISIPEWVINKGGNYKENIKCKLFALIPLDLKVSGEVDADAPSEIRAEYVSLDLKELSGMGTGTGDLFGRKEGGDSGDNIINDIYYVEILVEKINITIIDRTKLAVLIKNQSYYELLKFNEDSASLKFDRDFIDNPFCPEFTVLMARDAPGSDGSFKINRQQDKPLSFDFKLYVKAKVAIKYILDL